MYRKEIKVLDCTIRDGGLMNNHLFADDFVRSVFRAVNNSGVDYIELGYKADENQFSRAEYGPMKFCSEKDIENAINGQERKSKYSELKQIPFDKAIKLLKPLLENPSVLKIGHNIKYDIEVLYRYGIDLSPLDDTMILS